MRRLVGPGTVLAQAGYGRDGRALGLRAGACIPGRAWTLGLEMLQDIQEPYGAGSRLHGEAGSFVESDWSLKLKQSTKNPRARDRKLRTMQ